MDNNDNIDDIFAADTTPPSDASGVMSDPFADPDSLFDTPAGATDYETKMGLRTLINSNAVCYERLPMLDVVMDRFVRLLSTNLRNFTAENVEANLESLKSVRFGDYIQSVPNPSIISIFFAKEWDNYALMMADSELAYALIDVLLGGKKKASESGESALPEIKNMAASEDNKESRSYTTIECNLMSRVMELILVSLRDAFLPLTPVQFSYERLETNPGFATIVRPSNAVILVHLSIDVDGRAGFFELVLPYATLEPIRDLLLQSFMGEKMGHDSIWEDHLGEELLETDVEIEAVLDQIHLPLSEVLSWQPGSQVKLEAEVNSPVVLFCNNVPLVRGVVGHKAGNIAIKTIDSLAERKEDELWLLLLNAL